MKKLIRVGTRDSQLAVWQARHVQQLLSDNGYQATLVPIKSEGDLDLQTPLYELGVQGVFTRSLDAALLNNTIDIAVHSMKDVPTQPARGIVQAAVLKRASYKDIFVYKEDVHKGDVHRGDVHRGGPAFLQDPSSRGAIATSSIRRRAQWLHRYPNHTIENLRGNVNTRLRKVAESNWNGAIFAAAGLERIGLRPSNSLELDWMLPAPAQGAIMVVCKEADTYCREAGERLNDAPTALCTKIERDFLRQLLGGCSTPISGWANIEREEVVFKGNIVSTDGKKLAAIEKRAPLAKAEELGILAAKEILDAGGQEIIEMIRKTS